MKFASHSDAINGSPVMRFVSTRGGVPPATFVDALLTGAPLDGGSFVPHAIPKVAIKPLRELAFEPLATELLSLFIVDADDGFDRECVREVVREALQSHAHADIAPVVRVRGKSTHVCELFHGATLSAEDASMQITMRLIERALVKRGRRANIVCSTTGEAGGALASASSGLKTMDAWIVYPGDEGGVSEAQEREMTCHVEDNVHPVKVSACPDGMSDIDAVVGALMRDEAFRMEHGLVCVNSCNVARVLSYVPVFFYAYSRVVSKEEYGREVVFSVPSSAFGYEFAGHIARMMGLPIAVVCACNPNGAAHRVIELGELYKTDLVHTSSSALDIVVPENIWRSLYYALGENPLILSDLQDDFDDDGEVVLPPKVMRELSTVFKSAVVDETMLLRAIKREEASGYLPCPQTALAIAALDMVKGLPAGAPVVALGVSHPSKFPDVIRRAVPSALDSPASHHPTVDAMAGLFHRRRTCALEQLERSLRRDIPAVTKLRKPAPVRIERSLLDRPQFDALKRSSKRLGWLDFDNPVVSIAAAVVIAIWAAVTSPASDTSARESARLKRESERRARREAARKSKDAKAKAKVDAKAEKQRLRALAKASKTPEVPVDPLAGIRPLVYARSRTGPRLPNPHFELDGYRNLTK